MATVLLPCPESSTEMSRWSVQLTSGAERAKFTVYFHKEVMRVVRWWMKYEHQDDIYGLGEGLRLGEVFGGVKSRENTAHIRSDEVISQKSFFLRYVWLGLV